jgi:16S rRNA (uracil1498-N3)-methyltransferase
LSTPYFYIPSFNSSEDTIQLDEETSKHISGVLRMKKGELLQLTDGKGHLAIAELIDDHRKKCIVRIQSISEREKGYNWNFVNEEFKPI